jgi:hypothetical protein
MNVAGRGDAVPQSDDGTEESLTEFLALADRLQMPETERQGILGLYAEDWPNVAEIPRDAPAVRTEEFRRRLRYILPLMRRAVANGADTAIPPTR